MNLTVIYLHQSTLEELLADNKNVTDEYRLSCSVFNYAKFSTFRLAALIVSE